MTPPARHDVHTLAAAGEPPEERGGTPGEPSPLDLIRTLTVEQRRLGLQFAAFAESLYPELRRRVRIKCQHCGHEGRYEVGELR